MLDDLDPKAFLADKAYDADALQLIQAWIDTNYGGPLQTNNYALIAMCDKLATNPACDDPLVLTVAGANEIEMHEAVQRFDRALKGYAHSRYKAYPQLYATVTLAAKWIEGLTETDKIARY